MSARHVIPGSDDLTCGIAVAAKHLIARGVGEDNEVWVHSMWLPMVLKASFKALLTGKKLVRMPHGCTDPVKLRHHWHKKRWVAPIERWIFRHAYRIVATCEDEVEWIKKFEPRVRKVEIVRLDSRVEHEEHVDSSGKDFNAETQRHREIDFNARHLHASTRSTRLLYIGRLHPLKGVEYLLQAMDEIQNSPRLSALAFARLGSLESRTPLARRLRVSALKLVIIGKDEGEGAKLKAIAASRNLDVEFRGIVSDAEKEDAYKWCDCLVLPTLSENFGLVIAEALERGKHVITTDGAPAWGSGNTYDDRLIYLRGYRDGTQEVRIALLKGAIQTLITNR